MTTLTLLLAALTLAGKPAAQAPFFHSELIFPLQSKHNHGSCVVELPNGDLLAVWYHGSGERWADDVKIMGARLPKGSDHWTKPLVYADNPGFPDTNPCLIVDPMKRLWLFWPTQLDNRWEGSLMQYKVSSDYRRADRVPVWQQEKLLLIKPGPEFQEDMKRELPEQFARTNKDLPAARQKELHAHMEDILKMGDSELTVRLGWMTRPHPFILDGKRLIVPLSSDGFEFALVAWTDDWGKHWHTSAPIVGEANQQPSIVERKDGTLVAFMRDDGPRPVPHVLLSESHDRGQTWTSVHDSPIVDTGAGVEAIVLKDGRWLLVNNDIPQDRYQLGISISEDEGKTWPWVTYLERDPGAPGFGSYCYPSIIQRKDGTIDVTYSYSPNAAAIARIGKGESIKHAHFNEAWLLAHREPLPGR